MGRYADGSYYADSNLSENIQAAGMMGNYAQSPQGQAQQVNKEDEEEQDYRKYRLLQVSKDMDQARMERSMRQGYYTSPEQMVGDQYSQLYSQSQNTDPSSPKISMDGAQFPGMRQSIAPDASQRLSLFNQASSHTTGMSPEQIKARADAEAAARIKVNEGQDTARASRDAINNQLKGEDVAFEALSKNINPKDLPRATEEYKARRQAILNGQPQSNFQIPDLGGFPVLGGLQRIATQKPVADPHEKIVVDVAPIKQAAAQSTQAMQAGQPQSGGGGQFVPQDAATWQKFIQSWQKKNPGKQVSEAIQEYQARGGQ